MAMCNVSWKLREAVSNILDLVFCNDPILMSHIDVLPPFSSSDHNAIEFVISCESTDYSIDSGETRKHYLWSEGDYESMAAYLHQVRWPDLLTTNFTANDLWSAFCNVINNAIDLFVSYTFVSSQPGLKKVGIPGISVILLIASAQYGSI